MAERRRIVRWVLTRNAVLFSLLIAGMSGAFAEIPPLREQFSLNGRWEQGGTVPDYVGSKFDQRTYQRQVRLPRFWAGKITKLEFEAVNFIADVYVNDKLVVSHVGGWNPFSTDITNLVRPGTTFTLKVNVKGSKHSPIVDAKGKYAWPVGGWADKAGIADNVWLRQYGRVYIEDAFIQTSLRQWTLTIDYTVRNADGEPHTVRIEADASRPGRRMEKYIIGPTVTVAPGETKTMQLRSVWTTPELWWSDSPVLYHLNSRLIEGDALQDQETRPFGFREIRIAGNQFLLNGIRANLFGDYQVFGDTWYTSPSIHTPQAWPDTMDKMKSLNIRIVRWHHNPVPRYILDAADEKGLLIVSESAMYGRKHHQDINKAEFVKNCNQWIGPWIKATRNHPSVVIWSAENEMGYKSLGALSKEQLKSFGDTIRQYDTTRPVEYDGDQDVGDPLQAVNLHYPEGYNKEPKGSIYGWANLVRPDKPTGAGEVLHTKSPEPDVQTAVERNTWWLGIWLRGMRYAGFTDVRPACYWFAGQDLEGARATNLRNAYAPVALFDKEYDDLGIAPYVTGTTPGGTFPTVDEGATLNRTLILYNDEFRGASVTVEIVIKSGARIHATGMKTFDVPLGEHIDIPYSFQVPYVGGSEMEAVLMTRKGGVKKFEESRRFQVKKKGLSGRSSDRVAIGL